MSEIEQNSDGTRFAVAFLDDGHFKLRTFGSENRTEEEALASELDINKELGLDNHTMPINNFPDPFISCCFVRDDMIFVNLFHNEQRVHYHFMYHTCDKKITQYTKIQLDSNNKNFPVKCFYNQEYNEVYSFYRQGMSFRVPVFDIECDANYIFAGINTQKKKPKKDYIMQDIYDKDLGQMFLINETALICRSSNLILFFKLEID